MKKLDMQIVLSAGFASLCAFFILAGCDMNSSNVVKETRPSMHTIVTITAVSDSTDLARKALEEAYAELDRLTSVFNFYDEKSELSAINRNAGIAPVKVSPEVLAVIDKAVYVSRMTDGAFDSTVGSLVRLWDIKKRIVPEKTAIDETREKVGYENIVIDKVASTVYLKNRGCSIDLGGIVKGYAADRVVEILKGRGIKAGIAQVGGEVRTFGKRPDGSAWTVGIQNPRQKGSGDEIVGVIDISDKALSTSGDYQRYFEKDGRRYHHLIDPKTGYPSLNCGSATVLADNGITADGFSKLFVLGPKKGIEAAKKAGVEVMFIDCNGEIVMSDGMKERVRLLGK
jgi:thiamine biosynthesis lipoprotein